MKAGISTASLFSRDCVENVLDIIKYKAGCDVAEVFLNTFSEYSSDFFGILKQRLDELELSAVSLHPQGTQFEPALFSIYERSKRDSTAIFLKILKGMERIGAHIYVMHGPANMSGAVKNVSFSRIGPILRELCNMASDYGVTIAYENVSWCLFNTPDFATKLVDATESDRLRFTLDIKQAMRSNCSPYDFLNAMGSRLINVHACDYAYSDSKLSLKMPGKGEFDFAALIARLREINYSGNILLEVYSDMYRDSRELCASFNYLNALLS